MKTILKAMALTGIMGLLTACVHYPDTNRYYHSSNSYYGQGQNYGYPHNRYAGYRKPYPYDGYRGYRRPSYGYQGYNDQGPYCPDRRYR